MSYKNYRRYPRYSENYKLIRKFMKVVPNYLPKFNALIDSPEATSEEWLNEKMREIIEAAEREKAQAPGVSV